MILFTYVFSFGFTRVQSNREFFSVIVMMVRMSYTVFQRVKGGPFNHRDLELIDFISDIIVKVVAEAC